MTVYARPFKASDLTVFVPIEPMDIDSMEDPEFAKAIEESGLAVTGICDGKIVGCGGVHPVQDREGVGEMWLRLSDSCKLHPYDTLRWLREGMKIIEETFPFDQLFACIRCCFTQSVKLVKYLGFEEVERKQDWVIYKKLVRL